MIAIVYYCDDYGPALAVTAHTLEEFFNTLRYHESYLRFTWED